MNSKYRATQIIIKILSLVKKSLFFIWRLLRELGGISLILTVATFWIIQYNTYIQAGNAVRADTGTNITSLESILADKTRTWAYLHPLFADTYNNNWNFIAQYYNPECFNLIRSAAFNIESLNTLIIQRQNGNTTLGQDTLYQIAEILKPNLEKIMNCSLKPWHAGIVNKLY